MKKLLLIVCVIFCSYSIACANLAHEKEYWIEEINKQGLLTQNMISKHFGVSLESYAENIFGGSKSDMESWRKTTLVIAEVIEDNASTLRVLNIEGFKHQQFNNFYINTLLNAVVANQTIETLICTRAPKNAAFKVADIIKKNQNIQTMEFQDSDFDDKGILAIAKSLNTNNTLQTLSIPNSKFSRSSRAALRNAWYMNRVEGRKQDIEF